MQKYVWRLALLFCFLFPQPSRGTGNDNVPGVAGYQNPPVVTAGSIDPYTGNARRVVDDLTVAGSVGEYPLKWSRYLNTRSYPGPWSYSYAWYLTIYNPPATFPPPCQPYNGPDMVVSYPTGRKAEYFGGRAAAGLDPLDQIVCDLAHGTCDLILNDGGRVKFEQAGVATSSTRFRAIAILDPYGQTTGDVPRLVENGLVLIG